MYRVADERMRKAMASTMNKYNLIMSQPYSGWFFVHDDGIYVLSETDKFYTATLVCVCIPHEDGKHVAIVPVNRIYSNDVQFVVRKDDDSFDGLREFVNPYDYDDDHMMFIMAVNAQFEYDTLRDYTERAEQEGYIIGEVFS